MSSLVLINENHLTDIGDAIREFTGLTDKFLPSQMASKITYIPLEEFLGGNYRELNSQATAIKDGACYHYTVLTSVNLPNAVTIGHHAFTYDWQIKTLNLPVATSIGEEAFAGCYSISEVDLPCVTSLGAHCFATTRLTKVILRANSVCNLEGDAPQECFTYYSTSGNTAFQGYIYVPADLVDSYKNDSRWSSYADRIRAIT